MTVPYNAPGGQLEQMLLSNQFEDDFDKVREEVDGLRPMSADGLIRHFVGPIGAEPNAILNWQNLYGLIDSRYEKELHKMRDDRITKMNDGMHHWVNGAMMQRWDKNGGYETKDELGIYKIKTEDIVRDMDNAMTPHNKTEVVWRGIRKNKPQFTIGEVLDEQRFTATSTSFGVAVTFAEILHERGLDTILEIWIPPNVKTAVCNTYEQEVVIERMAKFEVMGIWQSDLKVGSRDLYQYVRLQALPPTEHAEGGLT